MHAVLKLKPFSGSPHVFERGVLLTYFAVHRDLSSADNP